MPFIISTMRDGRIASEEGWCGLLMDAKVRAQDLVERRLGDRVEIRRADGAAVFVFPPG